MHRRSFLTLFLVTSLCSPAWAGNVPYDTSTIEGVALGGYDATSYLTGKPMPGDVAITENWQGVTWRFATAVARDQFKASPEKYAPQYGGHCAYAAAKGALAPGDPEAWTIHENKLYINLSPAIRETWSKDIAGNVSKADKNWPSLMGQ